MTYRPTPECGFPSSVSDQRCVLPAYHEADGPFRFHRFIRQERMISASTPLGSDDNWLEDLYEDMRRQAADPVNRALLRGQPSGTNPSYAVGIAVQMARIRHAALPWWRRAWLWLYWRTPRGRSELERRLGELERGTR